MKLQQIHKISCLFLLLKIHKISCLFLLLKNCINNTKCGITFRKNYAARKKFPRFEGNTGGVGVIGVPGIGIPNLAAMASTIVPVRSTRIRIAFIWSSIGLKVCNCLPFLDLPANFLFLNPLPLLDIFFVLPFNSVPLFAHILVSKSNLRTF